MYPLVDRLEREQEELLARHAAMIAAGEAFLWQRATALICTCIGLRSFVQDGWMVMKDSVFQKHF